MEKTKRPLDGITVLEFEAYPPLSFWGLMLAEYGAAVIKVDSAKSLPVVDNLTRGKLSIIVDLKKKEGDNSLETILNLLPSIDVILESYRPGTMERLGLGPEDVRKFNKNIIYGRLSGFGQTSAYKYLAGHDMTYLSMTGIADLFRRYQQNNDPSNIKRDKPVIPWNLMADFMAGSYYLLVKILERLAMRSQTLKSHKERMEDFVIDSSLMHDSAFVFREILNKENKGDIDAHDLCRHPLNAVYCSKDDIFFTICLNKSDWLNPEVVRQFHSLIKNKGYKNDSLSLDDLDIFLKSFCFDEIKDILKTFPIVQMLEPENIRNDNINIYFDGKSRYAEALTKRKSCFEPIPSAFNNSSYMWEDPQNKCPFSSVETKKGDIWERGKGFEQIRLKLHAKI